MFSLSNASSAHETSPTVCRSLFCDFAGVVETGRVWYPHLRVDLGSQNVKRASGKDVREGRYRSRELEEERAIVPVCFKRQAL
ncbi:hypothetical protein TRAPUB_10788 [Trametes pubescens]|uniref:Uncharacterized protein n=1 Tax=Trametes pubescens TaxID=154538 RepID=A0A1M2VYJ8_TRAPU|nr:hypothetical protein TRAPUB_10788 [Trametes pubescens]